MEVLFCIRRPVIVRTLEIVHDNFYVIFFNNNSSVDIASIPVKFLGNVLYNTIEGSVSPKFDLGPGYVFMLCRN